MRTLGLSAALGAFAALSASSDAAALRAQEPNPWTWRGNEVRAGDCVFVPSGHTHGIRNHTGSALRYFSAAAPAFSDEDIARFWPLEAETDQAGRQL
ncbi:MAG: hypothetical protein AAB409_07715 [Gemmatimonadota bacterium]